MATRALELLRIRGKFDNYARWQRAVSLGASTSTLLSLLRITGTTKPWMIRVSLASDVQPAAGLLADMMRTAPPVDEWRQTIAREFASAPPAVPALTAPAPGNYNFGEIVHASVTTTDTDVEIQWIAYPDGSNPDASDAVLLGTASSPPPYEQDIPIPGPPGAWKLIARAARDGRHTDSLPIDLEVAVEIPLGSARWQNGLWLDVPALGLPDAYVITTPLVPQVGAVPATPINGPRIDAVGIGGRSAVRQQQKAPASCFTAHGLSAIVAGSDKPMSWIARVRRWYPVGNMGMLGFANSAQSTNDYLRCFWTGGFAPPRFAKDAIGEATKTLIGTGNPTWADHVVAITTDGTTGWLYVDGVQVATGDMDTIALTCNRLALFASHSTAPFEQFDGWWSHVGLCDSRLTAGEVVTVTNFMRASDLPYPGQPGSPQIAWLGASICEGSHDQVNEGYAQTWTLGGWRQRIFEYCRLANVAVNSVGPFVQGYFPDYECIAHSGADNSLVNSYINTYLGSGGTFPNVRWAYAGEQSANELDTVTPQQSIINYRSVLNNLAAKLLSTQGHAYILASTLLQQRPDIPFYQQIPIFNSLLPAMLDSFEAAQPNITLTRWDPYAALEAVSTNGTPFDQQFFFDHGHPNWLGYNVLGASLWPIIQPSLMALVA